MIEPGQDLSFRTEARRQPAMEQAAGDDFQGNLLLILIVGGEFLLVSNSSSLLQKRWNIASIRSVLAPRVSTTRQ